MGSLWLSQVTRRSGSKTTQRQARPRADAALRIRSLLPLVDGAAQHHFDNLQGLLVGDTQSFDETGLDTQPCLERCNFFATAVDDDRRPRLRGDDPRKGV